MKKFSILLLLITLISCYKSAEQPAPNNGKVSYSAKAAITTATSNTRIQQFYLSKESKQVFKLPVGARIIGVDNIKELGRMSVELNPAQTMKENRVIQVVELSLNGGPNPYVDANMPAGYECIYIGQYTLDYSTFYVYEAKKL